MRLHVYLSEPMANVYRSILAITKAEHPTAKPSTVIATALSVYAAQLTTKHLSTHGVSERTQAKLVELVHALDAHISKATNG